jgi:hypothetical protein
MKSSVVTIDPRGYKSNQRLLELEHEREEEKSPETTRGLIRMEPHQVEEFQFDQAITTSQP